MKTTEYLSCIELLKSDHVRFYQKIYKQCLKIRSDNYDVFRTLMFCVMTFRVIMYTCNNIVSFMSASVDRVYIISLGHKVMIV